MEDVGIKLGNNIGDTQTLYGPTGIMYVIRQQTGEDDDILSNTKLVKDGTSSNSFVQNIIVETDHPDAVGKKLDIKGMNQMKLCDKYFLMIASRIFSLGQKVKFSYKWSDIPHDIDYEEDLGLYIWEYGDLELPFPKKGDPDFFLYRIPPHPHGKDITREITLSTGKKVRYTFINCGGESYLMKLPPEKQSINSELMARNLELSIENAKWVKVYNFKTFTSMEMADIRTDVSLNDPDISLISELEHPNTGEKVFFPIVGTSNFFFPRET